MTWDWVRRMWKTLRFRLAVWNAVVVVTTALVILFGLRQGVRWALLHEMDQILTEDTQEIALAIRKYGANDFDLLTDELKRKSIGHRHHQWFAYLMDADRRVVWASAAIPAAVAQSTRPAAVPTTAGEYRLVDATVRHSPTSVVSFRVGASMTLLDKDIATIDGFVLATAAAILFVAPLLGYLLAGRAARAVGLITATAERLKPSQFGERMPVRGTGDELDRLAVTINRLLDRIAEDMQRKRDFLANAAHELRTPLAAIRSSVEVALNSDRSQEEYQELLVEIIDQGASLETLVNQLLLISESEAERLKLDQDPVSLDVLLKSAAEMFVGVAEARGLTLVVQVPQPVLVSGNRHLLRQLINNLLDNAIKYTPRGGRIDIELSSTAATGEATKAVCSRDNGGLVFDGLPAVDECDSNPGGAAKAACPRGDDGLVSAARLSWPGSEQTPMVTLSVADTGIGISQTDLPRIFDRFYRADKSRTRLTDTVGTGLGLSICQAVAEAHGGQIRCHSRLGEGTQFVVTLPALAIPVAAVSGAAVPVTTVHTFDAGAEVTASS